MLNQIASPWKINPSRWRGMGITTPSHGQRKITESNRKFVNLEIITKSIPTNSVTIKFNTRKIIRRDKVLFGHRAIGARRYFLRTITESQTSSMRKSK